MDFITTLKNEHQTILKILDEITALAKTKTSVLPPLKTLEDVIGGHLKKEDEILYPKFLQSQEEELKKLGMIFSDQMKIYSVEIVDCLNEIKKAEGQLDAALQARYKKIVGRIYSRVSIEETILFPAYIKYFGETEI